MNNVNKYYYRVYGMKITSTIEIPEFPIIEGKCEGSDVVEIITDKLPEDIRVKIQNGKYDFMSKDSIWFHVNEVADFWIKEGKKVVISPCEHCDTGRLKNYIMGSVMGFLLLQRQEVAIHGGTVVVDGKGIIITGHGGAGKSTLALTLGERGYKYLSDDISMVKIADKLYVEPGFPYHKLCLDVIEKKKLNKVDYLTCRGAKEVKYVVPDFEGFEKQPVPLHSIWEIAVDDVDCLCVEEIKKSDKVKKIISNIYKSECIGRIGGIAPLYFKSCIEVGKGVKYFKIIRPRNKNTIEDIIEILGNYEKQEKIGNGRMINLHYM